MWPVQAPHRAVMLVVLSLEMIHEMSVMRRSR